VHQKVCGKNWALLGDAAGFADAITASGIYFGSPLPRASLAIVGTRRSPKYERAWREDFRRRFAAGGSLAGSLYSGTLLFQSSRDCAVQLIRLSRPVQRLSDT